MYKHSDAAKELGVSCITKHPLYVTWTSIKARCNAKSCSTYKHYGAVGINLCDRWSLPKGEGFKNFVIDMGNKPTEKCSIDRIDCKGDYCPENCRWATPLEQARNRGMQKNNTIGYTGVSYEGADSNKNSPRYRAFWFEDGRMRRKSFSVNRYGEVEAYRLACEYRDLMIDKLNDQGAGYSEGHGKIS